jgi:hypothetical protein
VRQRYSSAVFSGCLCALRAEVAGHQRTLAADALPDLGQVVLEAFAPPFAPALGEPVPVAPKAMAPERVEAGRDDRGVVGPVLEQRGFGIDQPVQLLAPIGLVAREQDVVVGALHGLDAVDLDVAQALDQIEQAPIVEALGGIVRQPLGRQQQAPRRAVGDDRRMAR